MVLFPFLRKELPEESFIAKYFESQGEPAIYEEPRANMDPAELRASVQNDPGVLAVKAQQDRLKALANQNTEEIIEENNEEEEVIEVDDSGTITPTITGIREYTRV